VSIFLYRCNQTYYARYNAVKKELKKIDGIEILKIWGNEDLTLEDIYATVRLNNGDTLRFSDLGKWSFDTTKSLSLTRINNWEFHSTGCSPGGHWGGGGLGVGENSQYSQIKQLHMKNVQDVINHIDTLKSIVSWISIHPKFDTLRRNDEFIYFQKYNLRQVPDTRELKWADCP
jgi:hypothetical protein